MERIGVGKVEVDHCGRCGATWFDPYELARALHTEGAVDQIDFGASGHAYSNEVFRQGELHCPRDKSVLVRVPDPMQPHIWLDICRECGGVLLDAGELKDLSEYTLGERIRSWLRGKKK